MTKHDYQKAFEDVYRWNKNIVRGGKRTVDIMALEPESLNAIVHALKLAAIVTGEPSYEMAMAGCEAWKKHPMAVVTQFKAMIAEAQKEVQGGGE